MRRRLLPVLGLLALLAYVGLDVAQRARVDRGPRHHRTDFTVYQAAAEALRTGADPYEARSPRGYLYVYPPLLAVALMPVARWDPPWAVALFALVSAGALTLSLRALARLPGVGGRALLLGTLVAAPFLHQSFERGQITVLLLALQVGGTVLLARRRELAAGTLLGLGGALRLTPLLLAAAAAAGALAALRSRGPGPLLRLGAGTLGALALGFALLPGLALGPQTAARTLSRWVERTTQVHAPAPGEAEDLLATQGIDEWRFKNQAPHRVLGTWTGWLLGRPFDGERPLLRQDEVRGVDALAWGVAGLALLGSVWVGWSRLREPGDPRHLPALAALGAAHLLAERATWPTHLTAVLPALVLVAAWSPGARRRWTLAVFVAAEAAFYAAHLPALEPVGQAGCLLLGLATLLSALLGRGAGARSASALPPA